MNRKSVVTNVGVLLLAGVFYLLTAATLWEAPVAVFDVESTGRFLWESRSLDIMIQFIAMFSGALGILALTKEEK